ncbi:MAG: hypothetical protein INR71_10510, partial [Terriglobus roseus]|nr:hypothetical protein [Terriglobus roseus]
MGGHGMGGHHGGGGGGGGGRGSGGIVPFRPGDWKCANEQCNYHNFAKNPHCLRCGGPRNTHVDANPFPSGMDQPGSNSAAYGLGPPSMAGTPGPATFATPAGFGSGAFGPPGGFGAPPGGPSSYGMPGLGAPYGMGAMSAGYGPANGGMPPPSGFDARAEAAFSGANTTAGAAAFGNGAGGFGGSDPAAAAAAQQGQGQATAGSQQQQQGGDINLSFLSSGFGALSMSDERGRSGGAGQTKSPA